MKSLVKTKVLHYLSHGRIGGQERAMYQLFRAFENDSEFEFGVVFGEKGGFYLSRILELNINSISLQSGSGFSLHVSPKIIKFLKNYKIHHFHDPSPNQILPCLLLRKGTIRLFTRRGGLIDYSRYGLKKKLKHRVAKYLIRHYFHGYSGNTKTALEYIERYLNITGPNQLLYNGIDFGLLEPRKSTDEIALELCLKTSDFKIGTACQLVELKRVDLLIRAFHRANIPGKKLIIFGQGIAESALRSLVRELGAEQNVFFAGQVEHMPDFMQVLNCYVQASGPEESFGNAVVEAMYMKVPSVIMRDGGGMLEHIQDGLTGWIAQDVTDLARKLESIWANKETALKIAAQASEFIQRKYSIANMVSAYKEFYYSALR
jgi:glycosyltransferase involved in cell wall biosynthesis